MIKDGPRIEHPTREDFFVSPIVAINDRLVRPGDVLVQLPASQGVVAELGRRNARPYNPIRENPETDFRQRRGAPPYGDLNKRLERANLRLYVGLTVDDQVELIEERQLPGLHYNHVFIGNDFYHGGPGGPPSSVPGPAAGSLPKWTGNRGPDIAVLDNGMPSGWETMHPHLRPAVDRLGLPSVPQDPVDENGNNMLDSQAGHGLFICGLISRVAPELDIQLNRVLHASGEGDESLITATLQELLNSPVKVINLSLGTFIPGAKGPLLATTIQQLVANGKIVVASSGNEAGTPYGPAALFPASMPEVLAVGAYDSGCDELWEKSCRADVYAPGVGLLSTFLTWNGKIEWTDVPAALTFDKWAKWSGTSFAAPLVAAELARRLAKPGAGTAAAVRAGWFAEQTATTWPDKPGTGTAPKYELKDLTTW